MTSLSSLLAGMGAARIDARAGEDPSVDAVTIDSRKVKPGTLFVACPGATPSSKDGHEFLAAAVAAGAAAVVVTRREAAASLACPAILVDDARAAAAVLAERVVGSPSQKLAVVGITGTNGKTTATWLVAQLAAAAGKKAAVLGTLGVGPVERQRSLGFTTPEAEVLSQELARLAADGFDVVAMEVSSHALATKRVEGISFAATAFTNLSRDHLDFHGTMEAYFEAKARLFTELAKSAPAVLPAADARLRALRPDAQTWAVAPSSSSSPPAPAAELLARGMAFSAQGMRGTLVVDGAAHAFTSPLLGAYNVENLLVAAGCARALGVAVDDILRGIATATAPPGRLQVVSRDPLVVVDYAHTPDALERALHVMRGVTTGKLIVAFGAGGDRDAGKRPIMGAIAADIADAVVITDDNPRSESGDAIAAAIEAGLTNPAAATDRLGPSGAHGAEGAVRVRGSAPKRRVPAHMLDDGTYAVERARRMAIRAAVAAAHEGDAVLIAGKGHEKTQTIGARAAPFDDVKEAERALAHLSSPALLDESFVRSVFGAMGARFVGAPLPRVLAGVSTDSRAIEPASIFVALRGERFDAHEFVKAALESGGAGAALVERAVAGLDGRGAQIVVDDALAALQKLARAYLMTLTGRRVALTGSNGKTTTKELIAACLRAAYGAPYVVATEGNLNNHIGVPLTALRCEPEHKAMVFEMGMNHLREIELLADIVRPEVGLITNIGTAHAGNVGGVEGVAQAKAELFEALPADGVAVVNADDPRCIREAQAKAKCKHVSFGWAQWADVRLERVTDRERGGQDLTLVHDGVSVDVALPLEGRHNAQNAAGAVAVGVALGLDFATCARGLAHVHAAHGRLERVVLAGDVWVLDDTYNANPDSMEAALQSLVELGKDRRRVVVLGEMRELGEFAEKEHTHIGAGAGVPGVAAVIFACGALGKLYGEGAAKVGATPFVWAADNEALAALVVREVKDGDVVLVKGSRGARMEVVVDALKKARGKMG